MEFTTHFELHSQTTRLVEGATHGSNVWPNGVLTLYDIPFQGTWTLHFHRSFLYKLQFGPQRGQISNLSNCRFTRRY
jgi:hypothetical protein